MGGMTAPPAFNRPPGGLSLSIRAPALKDTARSHLHHAANLGDATPPVAERRRQQEELEREARREEEALERAGEGGVDDGDHAAPASDSASSTTTDVSSPASSAGDAVDQNPPSPVMATPQRRGSSPDIADLTPENLKQLAEAASASNPSPRHSSKLAREVHGLHQRSGTVTSQRGVVGSPMHSPPVTGSKGEQLGATQVATASPKGDGTAPLVLIPRSTSLVADDGDEDHAMEEVEEGVEGASVGSVAGSLDGEQEGRPMDTGAPSRPRLPYPRRVGRMDSGPVKEHADRALHALATAPPPWSSKSVGESGRTSPSQGTAEGEDECEEAGRGRSRRPELTMQERRAKLAEAMELRRRHRAPRRSDSRGGEAGLRMSLMRPAIGTSVWSVYDKEAELGEGMSGAVYRVRHKRTGARFALKSIDLDRMDPSLLHDLRNEIKLLQLLDHPNVIRLYEYFEEFAEEVVYTPPTEERVDTPGADLPAGHAELAAVARAEEAAARQTVRQRPRMMHLVLELCEGGELYDRLHEQSNYRFTEVDAARVVSQMLAAVAYVHRMGIAHRDLKLENFLFETRERNAVLKLIDFGLSRRYSIGKSGSRGKAKPEASAPAAAEPAPMGIGRSDNSISRMFTVAGTPYYTAPEVLVGGYRDDDGYTEACDVWSVGVIAYMLLSGTPPFKGRSDSEILDRVRKGRYTLSGPRWHGISEDAKNFIRSALKYNPKRRPSAKKAACHDWFVSVAHRQIQELKATRSRALLATRSGLVSPAPSVLSCAQSEGGPLGEDTSPPSDSPPAVAARSDSNSPSSDVGRATSSATNFSALQRQAAIAARAVEEEQDMLIRLPKRLMSRKISRRISGQSGSPARASPPAAGLPLGGNRRAQFTPNLCGPSSACGGGSGGDQRCEEDQAAAGASPAVTPAQPGSQQGDVEELDAGYGSFMTAASASHVAPAVDAEIVSALVDYAQADCIRRAAIATMALQLHPRSTEARKLRRAFLAIDVDFEGELTYSEFVDVLTDTGLIDRRQATKVFASIALRCHIQQKRKIARRESLALSSASKLEQLRRRQQAAEAEDRSASKFVTISDDDDDDDDNDNDDEEDVGSPEDSRPSAADDRAQSASVESQSRQSAAGTAEHASQAGVGSPAAQGLTLASASEALSEGGVDDAAAPMARPAPAPTPPAAKRIVYWDRDEVEQAEAFMGHGADLESMLRKSTIPYSTFLAAALLGSGFVARPEAVHRAFDSLEGTGAGLLSLEQLVALLTPTYAEAEVKEAFAHADKNGDGVVDGEEFYDAVMGPEGEVDTHRLSQRAAAAAAATSRVGSDAASPQRPDVAPKLNGNQLADD